jgi:acyl-homoserine-lactone acylase
VKPDLVAAVKATNPTGDVAAALALVEKWDNTSAPESRGSTLFEVWWQRYGQGMPDSLRYARAWTPSDPTHTPVGLSDKTKAAEAFSWAVTETARRYGRWDVTWGDVHRVRRGKVDVPVGGCGNPLGCFRILNFARDPDGKFSANGGDGWVLAVEFTDVPKAYSVLAYGESPDTLSRWHSDQVERFATGNYKRVASRRRTSTRRRWCATGRREVKRWAEAGDVTPSTPDPTPDATPDAICSETA